MLKKFIQYLKDVRSEMAKVSWPTRDEVVGATTLVVVVSLIASAVIFVFDRVLNQVMGFLLNM